MTPKFDVALALRRIVAGFWQDFAPIVLAGFIMVTLPSVALTLAGRNNGATVIATFGGLLRVLYVVIVVHGSLARIVGQPLTARAFVSSGLAASPRALNTAMLIGIGIVLCLVALLLAALAGPAALLLRCMIVAAAAAAAIILAAAVPLALQTRLSPWQTFACAAAMTRTARGSVAVVLAIAALALAPMRLMLADTVYGLGASTARIAMIDAAMTFTNPGLWLLALFDLMAWGVCAVIPAAIYAGLQEPRAPYDGR